MRTYTLRCEMLTKLPVAEVFPIFENPYNLARITPSWLNFRVTSKEHVTIRKGAEIEYRIRWFGLPIPWKSLITEYEPPFLFVDEQARGPYRLWRHRHTFRASEEGTIIGDRVEYALAFGPAGRAANGLIVARQLKAIFAYRQTALDRLLGAQSVRLLEPEITG